jgi:hypothetical protein
MGVVVIKPVVWLMAEVLPDKGFTVGHCSGLYSIEAFCVYLVLYAAIVGYVLGWLFTKILNRGSSHRNERA